METGIVYHLNRWKTEQQWRHRHPLNYCNMEDAVNNSSFWLLSMLSQLLCVLNGVKNIQKVFCFKAILFAKWRELLLSLFFFFDTDNDLAVRILLHVLCRSMDLCCIKGENSLCRINRVSHITSSILHQQQLFPTVSVTDSQVCWVCERKLVAKGLAALQQFLSPAAF